MSDITKHDGSGTTWETDTTVIPAVKTDEYAVARYASASMIPENPWNTQVGGSHYSKYAIQPTEYILKNNLNFCEGNVIKYITRYKDKGGVEDLRKARHYLDILISEMENGGY